MRGLTGHERSHDSSSLEGSFGILAPLPQNADEDDEEDEEDDGQDGSDDPDHRGFLRVRLAARVAAAFRPVRPRPGGRRSRRLL